ncbi:SCO family protein [Psychromonas hadalis]|uniref:SCO family protein n=1 Tax=Psychromonas hadalis TaxID=211669 RepID=UPI0003B4E355|nr:SCO family protein [Psychromonas hadalis]
MKKGLLGGFVFLVVMVSIFLKIGLTNTLSDNPSLVMQTEGKILPDFAFEMADHKVFNNESLLNHWTLLFVGYTFCPDICPTTLADLDRVYPELSKPPYDNIQIVFVSVDPNRDKANNLAEYVNYFNPHFLGTTSTHEQLFPFVQDLGLVYSIVDEGDSEDAYYLIDHSASLVLVNPQGEHQASFKAVLNEDGIPHVDMDFMVEDIHKIIQVKQ